MIEIKNVSKFYDGVKAVENISLHVEPGKTIALLGTSGCGKTTTLRMINRLTEPSSGEIIINGSNIKTLPAEELRRGIGYVLQHHGLFPHYTVAQNIAIVPRLLRWKESAIKDRTAEVMQKVRLPAELATAYPSQLSGGQQQRVGLARALASRPSVLLMDEPLGALDPVTRLQIRNEFILLDELRKTTVVLVTHDVQEAFHLGDTISIMDKGKIIQSGKPAELLFQPANAFIASFLQSQQLQLELENTTLGNLFSFLPKAVNGINEEVLVSELSVWRTLAMITKSQEAKRFVCMMNGDRRQVEAGAIMTAFLLFKQTSRYE